MRKYTKMGKKQKGPNSGETETRDRAGKRGASVSKDARFKTTKEKLDYLQNINR